MTTIVFDVSTGTIACDSRMTIGNDIASDDYKKFVVRDGVTFFFAGAVAEIEILIELYFDPNKSTDKLETEAIVVDGGVVYCTEFNNKHICRIPLTWNHAIGSGMYWAMAALDFGCDATGAVAYAKTKDSGTGGRIRSFKVKK